MCTFSTLVRFLSKHVNFLTRRGFVIKSLFDNLLLKTQEALIRLLKWRCISLDKEVCSVLYLMLKMFMVTKSSRAADITTEIMLLQKQTTLLFLACRQPFTYFPFSFFTYFSLFCWCFLQTPWLLDKDKHTHAIIHTKAPYNCELTY